ncbi:lytic transglycosylase domain-containing protein [Nocardioides sp. R-C-SC26]|uniref:lytic transglycosylase domain-containing protein n=1 Tax=Nocardioides sp. R-C-SC26 TaxID=2870414 RepID=UPI001E589AC6|nr:lytic transglycosylase domain-containing protein [Nocardioides sp. R-C-SC26]
MRPLRARPGIAVLAVASLATLLAADLASVALGAEQSASPAPQSVVGDGADQATDRAPISSPTSRPAAGFAAPLTVRATASRGAATRTAATATVSDIPAVALAAYQRTEAVIAGADAGCGLQWQLIAAIARVESDHGRFGGATLGEDGVARPSIRGPVLDGTGGTRVIGDTDGGQLDGDDRFDRAVGPLQFIPTTWNTMGVDGDGDGVRNPHDIDDAAVAAGVYLCSADDDLATVTGRRSAVYRYNHSASYVDLVLAVADAYLAGDPFVRVGLPVPVIQAGAITTGGARPAASQPAEPRRQDGGNRAALGPSREGRPDARPHRPKPDPEPDPEPGGETPIEPEPTSLTPEEAADYCVSLELVDDPDVADDEYDQCLVEYTLVETAEPTEPPAPSAPTPTQPATGAPGSTSPSPAPAPAATATASAGPAT